MNFFKLRPHWYLKFFTTFGLAPCHASPSPPWPPTTMIWASSKYKCFSFSSITPVSFARRAGGGLLGFCPGAVVNPPLPPPRDVVVVVVVDGFPRPPPARPPRAPPLFPRPPALVAPPRPPLVLAHVVVVVRPSACCMAATFSVATPPRRRARDPLRRSRARGEDGRTTCTCT